MLLIMGSRRPSASIKIRPPDCTPFAPLHLQGDPIYSCNSFIIKVGPARFELATKGL
jgi:hypothetical protein